MKLYYSPGACSLAPHILLNEVGAKFSLEPVNLQTKQYKGGDFTKVNPKGYVPTLELDNGQILTENVAIHLYIADLKPEANLIPKAGTFDRYKTVEWLAFITSELHKNFSPLFRDTTPSEYKTIAKETLAKRLDFVSGSLKSRSYLAGQQYTAPDAYLFTVLSWSPHVGVDLSKWPTLLGYVENVKNRPATQSALKTEGLVK